jgi:hypothetical protein
MLPVEKKREGLLLRVRVQPRAAKNQIAGLHNDAIKLRITAPPADNKANQACARFLAKQLDLPPSAITIASGKTSRAKQLFISYSDAEPEKVQETRILQKLAALVS